MIEAMDAELIGADEIGDGCAASGSWSLPGTSYPELLGSWLVEAVRREASDLHLVVGHPPMMRVHGELRVLESSALEPELLYGQLAPLCSDDKLAQLHSQRNLDFSLELPLARGAQRFRVNYFFSNQHLNACFRIIPQFIPPLDWAGFPADLAARLASFHNGLVLVTGVTGSGKTTTLAMLINQLNQQGGCRIITVEEPIEYVFPRVPGSLVTQREVGSDVSNFADGLKFGLRQDPDVILVGEIRDRETAQMALSAAETGHLVFSTLHTRDCKGAISRFTDLFPAGVQSEVRSQLALSLRAVLSQHLLPCQVPGSKRVLALEVMFNNMPISSAIRLGRLEAIDNSILTGRAEGMITLNESLRQLVLEGRISEQTAQRYISDAAYLRT